MKAALAPADLDTIGALLWRSRQAVDRLLHLLGSHLVLVRDDETIFWREGFYQSTALIVETAATLDALNDERRQLVHSSTLQQLIAAAKSPWDLILDDHADALRRQQAELLRRSSLVAATEYPVFVEANGEIDVLAEKSIFEVQVALLAALLSVSPSPLQAFLN